MKSSSYFEQTLFYDQSPATDQYFEQRSSQLFELDPSKSFVEVHFRLPLQTAAQGGPGKTVSNALDSQHKPDTDSQGDTTSPPRSPVDKCHYFRHDPPHYDGSPGLDLRRVGDEKQLSEIALASTHSFRICFIRQRHSYSRLFVTRDLFETLMSDFHILPRFREFVLLFGAKRGENEIGPPQLRFRRLPASSTALASRHYAGFECAYALRYVELNHREGTKPWSVRQTAVYHKYRADERSSTWVLISASKAAEVHLDRYMKSSRDPASLNPFEIHLILLDSALANWRPYIVGLTEQITKQSDRVLVASIDTKGPLQLLDVEERQELKEFEDQVIDILVVLDSTSDTISSLLEKYAQFCRESDNGSDNEEDDGPDPLLVALQEKQREVNLSRKKVEALHTKVQGTTSLLSSLLDLGNGYSLKLLAEEARKENLAMRRLTEKTTQDAAAVKVLTIITLIYLPATVVSNFFSTSFVSQVQDIGGSSSIVVSSDSWLFAAISIPLTIATLFVWWLWVRLQARKIRPSEWKFTHRTLVENSLKHYRSMRRPSEKRDNA